MKTRTEKIELLTGIKNGTRSVYELRATRFYILDCGVITNFAGRRLSIDELCKRFIPGKDVLLLVDYSAGNLPEKYNYRDPSGEILQEIVNRIPELDDDGTKEYINDAQDLRKAEFWQTIINYGKNR